MKNLLCIFGLHKQEAYYDNEYQFTNIVCAEKITFCSRCNKELKREFVWKTLDIKVGKISKDEANEFIKYLWSLVKNGINIFDKWYDFYRLECRLQKYLSVDNQYEIKKMNNYISNTSYLLQSTKFKSIYNKN